MKVKSLNFVDGLGFVNINFCPHFVMDGERCNELVTDVSDEVIVCVEDVSALVVTSCGDVIGNVYLYDGEFKKINYLDIK